MKGTIMSPIQKFTIGPVAIFLALSSPAFANQTKAETISCKKNVVVGIEYETDKDGKKIKNEEGEIQFNYIYEQVQFESKLIKKSDGKPSYPDIYRATKLAKESLDKGWTINGRTMSMIGLARGEEVDEKIIYADILYCLLPEEVLF